jgi:YD repeat-containing protein
MRQRQQSDGRYGRAGGNTTYGYDANNNGVSFNGKGNTTTYAYDSLNRRVKVTDPIGLFRSYSYDAVGNVVSVVDANGKTRTIIYDAINRPTVRNMPMDVEIRGALNCGEEAMASYNGGAQEFIGSCVAPRGQGARRRTNNYANGWPGHYALLGLPVGSYRLEVRVNGWQIDPGWHGGRRKRAV